MKHVLAVLATFALVTSATPPAPGVPATPAVTYYSAADLKSIGAQLGADSKHARFASRKLERYSNHYTMLAHREGNGSVELHVHEADIFFVVDGEAAVVTGGKIMNPKTESPGEIRGTSIEGGKRQELSAGDVLHIAANTPHQLLLEPGKQFDYFVAKVTNQ